MFAMGPSLLAGGVAAFKPSSLSGNTLWLDAADASTISATGGLVDQWRDKSGNVNHASGLTATRFTTGAATQNSKNVIQVTSGNLMTLTAALASNDITLITASKVVGGGASGQAILANNASSSVPLFGWTGGALSWDGFVTGANNGATYDLYSATRVVGAGTINLYAGSSTTPLATGSSGITGANTFNSIGNYAGIATYNFAGLIGEIIAYNRVLTALELGQVFTYLKAKWNTP